MPYLSVVSEPLNSRTPCVIISRSSDDGSVLQQVEIRLKGIRVKGIAKLLPWKNVLAIEHTIRTGKPKTGKGIVAKAITLTQGGALKLRGDSITYVAAWLRMPKGAEHPIGNIMTVGLTSDGVRFGRKRADVDKAIMIPWTEFVRRVGEKLRQVDSIKHVRGK